MAKSKRIKRPYTKAPENRVRAARRAKNRARRTAQQAARRLS